MGSDGSMLPGALPASVLVTWSSSRKGWDWVLGLPLGSHVEGLERGRETGEWGPGRNAVGIVSDILENVGKGIHISEMGDEG